MIQDKPAPAPYREEERNGVITHTGLSDTEKISVLKSGQSQVIIMVSQLQLRSLLKDKLDYHYNLPRVISSYIYLESSFIHFYNDQWISMECLLCSG